MKISCGVSSLVFLIAGASAFSPNVGGISGVQSQNSREIVSPLFMGRAAAVRAATKSKTDLKKSKTNALYGKKIIMAVKQGGPDPDGNRALADIIKQAKANSVPVDVSESLRNNICIEKSLILLMYQRWEYHHDWKIQSISSFNLKCLPSPFSLTFLAF